ncbi:MAG TPA: hypothetical protein VMJ93_02915 [Verrucomicrobiae bacterium]|nr:hypothetical protein [Verrucomicrobiae bacterium]
MKAGRWAWTILLWMPLAASGAQAPQQGQSANQGSAVADAARAAREAKKEVPKAAHVWDNDNIPTTPGAINVVGQTSSDNAAAGDNSGNGGAEATANAAPASGEDKVTIERELDDAKAQLQSLQTDLDILQRTFTLDQQMYYGKPDFESDASGAQKLKDEQAAIDAKQQQIEEMQKKIADLQSEENAAPEAKPSSDGASGAAAANPPANNGGSSGSTSDTGTNQSQNQNPPSTAPVPNN